MPIIVINMGGEMIYILHQRLQAQNVADEKARKVLEDVIRTMYTPMFIEELFKPQEVYTHSSTKQIFEKLAHSSIMRLNKTSMDKLYDLMTMGLKYQILACASPQQYLQLTLQHLDGLQNIAQSEVVNPLIQTAINRAIDLYTNMSEGNWLALQQTLLQFFQGRKVKVSLFLQQQLQNVNGVLVLNNHKGTLPFRTEKPGQIRYFENGSFIRSDHFHVEHSNQCQEATEMLDLSSSLGKNIYSKPNESSGNSSKPSASMYEAAKIFNKKYSNITSAPSSAAAPKYVAPVAVKGAKYSSEVSAKAELSVLAELLGVAPSSPSRSGSKAADDKPFRINLFPAQGNGFHAKETDGDKGGDDYDPDGGNSFIMFDIDATAGAKTIESYMEDLDLQEDADFKAGAKDDDDLLSLMDSAK
jgi:hypothetical protein